MLHLIPAWVQRPLMPAANKVRNVWRRIAKPDLRGVSVAAFDSEDRLLLVRHSYGTRKWALPAGGIGKAEDPEAGIRREVFEEIGIALSDVRLISHLSEQADCGKHEVWLFAARVDEAPRPDMREVIDARFFPVDDLPEPLEKRVQPRLDMLRASTD